MKKKMKLYLISKGYEKIKLILETPAMFMSCGLASDYRDWLLLGNLLEPKVWNYRLN